MKPSKRPAMPGAAMARVEQAEYDHVPLPKLTQEGRLLVRSWLNNFYLSNSSDLQAACAVITEQASHQLWLQEFVQVSFNRIDLHGRTEKAVLMLPEKYFQWTV
jgi:hypothetical protein